jgi:probable rRNA maturation factor
LIIDFFYQSKLLVIKSEAKTKKWIKFVLKRKKKEIKKLSIVFVSRDKIKKINYKFLNHNYETDVITFKYDNIIDEADIFICPFVLKRNSVLFSTTINEEALRIIIHGVLHLVGLNDKTRNQKLLMSKEEDKWLNFYKNNFNENCI